MSTETNNNDFEKLLPAGPEPVARLEARVALISKRRKGSSSANAALDRFLLESYAKLSDRSSSLDRQLNEDATSRLSYARLWIRQRRRPGYRACFCAA